MAGLEGRLVATVHLAWWVRPYIWLTRFGAWLGLPINEDVFVSDLMRGVRVTLGRE